MGKGVSSCATCDGAFFREKTVAVVGGGDSAMEEAIFLTKFATKVYLIHRRDELRASQIMQERARANERIEFILSTNVTEVKGEQSVKSLVLQNAVSQEGSTLEVDGMFLAIGHIPESDLVKKVLTIDDLGYLVPTEHSMSNIEGVFIAGDVHDHRYRQAVNSSRCRL